MPARDEHSSLLRIFVNYGLKSFTTLAPGLKGFPGTNGPAYLIPPSVTKNERFMILTPDCAGGLQRGKHVRGENHRFI
jgi:hypothetical protein